MTMDYSAGERVELRTTIVRDGVEIRVGTPGTVAEDSSATAILLYVEFDGDGGQLRRVAKSQVRRI